MEHVTILGGGIGGLTLGVALERNGVDYDIYERTAQYRPTGAGIILRSNAMQVYERLGLARRLREMGTTIEGTRTYSESGKILSDEDFSEQAGADDRQVDAGVHRAKLQQLLLDHNDAAAIHMGKECETVIENDDAVRVAFTDGTTIETDVLIGADGSFSVVREQVFNEVPVRYTNQVGHRGIPDVDVVHKNRLTQAWGKGVSLGIVPLAEREVYWFAVLNAEPHQEYDPREVKATVHEKAEALPDPFATLVAQTDPESILSYDYLDLPPLESWSIDRVAIMGDAAHSMTPFIGQGGCQAIEDAYVLGQVLAEHATPARAFDEYEAIRMEKANKIVEASSNIGANATLTSYPRRKLRNLVFKYYISNHVMPEQNKLIAELNY